MLHTELIPAGSRDSKWLLIALHGLGDSMDGYRWLPRVLQLPALNTLLVNAPDPYFGGFAWYDFAGDSAPGIARSRQFLTRLLDEQREKGFPPEKTFLFGFSQGCLMTIDTALRYPLRLAGCIGVSGYVWQPETLLQQLSPVAREQQFLLTHGTEDALIRVEQVRPQIESLRGAGVQIEWREFYKDHTIIEPELELIRAFIARRMEAPPAILDS